jgi:glycosyltransferase involved in cell wall biosynthesis
MRIIHIVENLDKGAVENWLVRMFLEARKLRPEWEWTFYCMLGKPGRLDDMVKAAGGQIIYSPVSISNKFLFLKHLRRTLKAGKFEVLHSHHDFLSGFYLLASHGIKFSKRVLHVHNTDKALPVGNPLLHKMLLNPFRRLAIHYNDAIVGISSDTLNQFVRDKKAGKKDYRVLYYGIDVSSFEMPTNRTALMNELNIPAHSKLLLFVGRLNEFKNPVFVVDVLKEMLSQRGDIYALFVGIGKEAINVQLQAKKHGIINHIRMLGWRSDTVSIMKAADVFIFPRVEFPKEGLGLVVVEAQAAGLPMLITHGIVEDAIVIKQLSHFLPLQNNPAEWAQEALLLINNSAPITSEDALQMIRQSPFELTTAAKNLMNIYENNLAA